MNLFIALLFSSPGGGDSLEGLPVALWKSSEPGPKVDPEDPEDEEGLGLGGLYASIGRIFSKGKSKAVGGLRASLSWFFLLSV